MHLPPERVQPPQQVRQSPVVLSHVLHWSLTATHCPFLGTVLKGQVPGLVGTPLLIMQAPDSSVQPSQQDRQSPEVESQVLHCSLTATHLPSFKTVLGAQTTVTGGVVTVSTQELQQSVSRVFSEDTSLLSLTSKVRRVGTVGRAALGWPGSLLMQPTLIFFMSASRLNRSILQVAMPMWMPLVTTGPLTGSERTTKRMFEKQPIPSYMTKRTTAASGRPSLLKSAFRMRSVREALRQPPFPSVITPSDSLMQESPPSRYVRLGSWLFRAATCWAQLLVRTMPLARRATMASNRIFFILFPIVFQLLILGQSDFIYTATALLYRFYFCFPQGIPQFLGSSLPDYHRSPVIELGQVLPLSNIQRVQMFIDPAVSEQKLIERVQQVEWRLCLGGKDLHGPPFQKDSAKWRNDHQRKL